MIVLTLAITLAATATETPATTTPGWHAGQHLVAGITGENLGAAQAQMLRELKPAGVILLGSNIRSEMQTVRLVRAIKEAAGAEATASSQPVIYVDQEGGRVNRLNLADSPAAAELGATPDPERARELGERYAREALRRGIGVVLAPVLDLQYPGASSVIGNRAFSEDPQTAYQLAQAFAEGVKAGGAMPVGKHFPGHGATREDSHEQLARLPLEGEALEETLAPFRQAAEDAWPALMVGHIASAALSPEAPDEPASMSAAMVQGLLRDDWGYGGVVITDDMIMGAVQTDLAQAAVQSLTAGVDLVMVSDPAQAPRVAAAIEAQAREDEAFRQKLVASASRIERFHARLQELVEQSGVEMLEAPAPPLQDAPLPDPAEHPDLYTQYEVQRGDTLGALAQRFGVTLSELKRINKLSSDLIRVGQELTVPK